MAANGLIIKDCFRRILNAALTTVGEYNEFVSEEAVARPKLDHLDDLTYDGVNILNEDRLDDILNEVASQFFQRPEVLETWVATLSVRYSRQRVVGEAVKRFEQEQAKPSLWAVSDATDVDQFVFKEEFLRDTISFQLKSRYRLDSFDSLSRRSGQDLEQDRIDFEYAKCIVMSRSARDDSAARDLTDNIINLAATAISDGKAIPRIVFTASAGEEAIELERLIKSKWDAVGVGEPPFFFLRPSRVPKDVKDQRLAAEAFLKLGEPPSQLLQPAPPPPPGPSSRGKSEPPNPKTENDLVILVGGKLTSGDDAPRFDELTKLLGQSDRLVIVRPRRDGQAAPEWSAELERKLGAAECPLLVEHVGENYNSGRQIAVFYEYLLQSAPSRPEMITMAQLQALLMRGSRQRLIWKPAGAAIQSAGGVEINAQPARELASLIKLRLGLAQDAAAFPAYVAVEEIIVNKKTDEKLRTALKKHLSFVVGGDGNPPSTDCVVPFPFRVLPDSDPLHIAVKKFQPSHPNIVAACDVSRGNRPLKQYLTEINARIRDGVNSYFKDKTDQAPGCILRIVVMLRDPEHLETQLVDDTDGSWRVIKFARTADGYEPNLNDLDGAQAWVNEQVELSR